MRQRAGDPVRPPCVCQIDFGYKEKARSDTYIETGLFFGIKLWFLVNQPALLAPLCPG